MISESQLRFIMTFRDQATGAIQRCGQAIQQTGRQAQQSATGMNAFAAAAQRADTVFTGLGNRLRLLARDLRSFSSVASVASGVGMYMSGRKFMESAGGFEQQLAVFNALSGATEQQLASLEQQVLHLGSSTAKTTGEVMDGALSLQRMGRSVEEIQAILPSLTNFSIVAQMDMDAAARVAGSTLIQFGLHVDQTQRVMDVIARGAHQSAADVDEFAVALTYAGSEARSSNLTLERTIALMEAASQAGIPGSRLGTGLQSVLNDIYMANQRQRAMYDQFSIETRSADGTPRDVLEVLQDIFDRIPAEMYGRFETDTARMLMGIRSQGLEAVRQFQADLENEAGGENQRIGEAFMSGIAGAMEMLTGAIDTLLIKIGQSGFTGVVTNMIYAFTNWVNALSEAETETLMFAGAVGALLLALNPIMFALGGVLAILTSLEGLMFGAAVALAITHWDTFRQIVMATLDVIINWESHLDNLIQKHPILVSSIVGVTTALAAMTLMLNAGAIAAGARWLAILGLLIIGNIRATAAQIALNIAMRANPLGLLVTGIAAVVAGLTTFISVTSDAAQKQRELNEAIERNESLRSGLANRSNRELMEMARTGDRSVAAGQRALADLDERIERARDRLNALGATTGERWDAAQRSGLRLDIQRLEADRARAVEMSAQAFETRDAVRSELARRMQVAPGGVPRVNAPFTPGPTMPDEGDSLDPKKIEKVIEQLLEQARALSATEHSQRMYDAARAVGLDITELTNEQIAEQLRLLGILQPLEALLAAQATQRLNDMRFETEVMRARAEIARLDQRAQDMANAELEARIEIARRNNAVTLEGINLTREQIDAIHAQVEAQQELNNSTMTVQAAIRTSLDKWAQQANDFGTEVANVMDTVIGGAIDNITAMLSGQEVSWQEWGYTIINMILRIIVQMLVMKAVMASLQFFGFADGGVPAPNAKGNVFGNAQAFAKGSMFANTVVDSPTLFRFGYGGSQLGIMGEAGPEAILPLKRMQSGRLGVEARTTGGRGDVFAPVIQINVESSGDPQMDAKSAEKIAAMVSAVIDKKMADFEQRQNRASNRLVSARG